MNDNIHSFIVWNSHKEYIQYIDFLVFIQGIEKYFFLVRGVRRYSVAFFILLLLL